MTNATDVDIQQLKDLITAGNTATQQQMTGLTLEMKVGFANIETKFAKLEGDIENRFTKIEGDIATLSSGVQNFEKRMSEMKNDQRAQAQRFFSLSIFIITFAVGAAAKLAKLY